MAGLGHWDEVEVDAEALPVRRPLPGPAAMVAEFFEHHDRLDDALAWFSIACRDQVLDALDADTLFGRPELQGRSRIKRSMGLPPDAPGYRGVGGS
ncbi:hypothetical protein [Actinocorallia longicatena]